MKSNRKNGPSPSYSDIYLSQLLQSLKGTRGRQPIAGLRRPGLVVLDLQRLFADPQSPAFLPHWLECQPRCFKLIEAFLHAGRPVIFTRHVHGPDDDGFLIGRFFGRLQRSDDPLSELISDVRSWASCAFVVDKDRHSALLQPEVAERLTGCDSIVLTGLQTPLCVLATALDAPRLRLVPVVVMDATAARTQELHLAALRCLAAGHAYVATMQEVFDFLQRTVLHE
jgi:nicotinamidase-related amidase